MLTPQVGPSRNSTVGWKVAPPASPRRSRSVASYASLGSLLVQGPVQSCILINLLCCLVWWWLWWCRGLYNTRGNILLSYFLVHGKQEKCQWFWDGVPYNCVLHPKERFIDRKRERLMPTLVLCISLNVYSCWLAALYVHCMHVSVIDPMIHRCTKITSSRFGQHLAGIIFHVGILKKLHNLTKMLQYVGDKSLLKIIS